VHFQRSADSAIIVGLTYVGTYLTYGSGYTLKFGGTEGSFVVRMETTGISHLDPIDKPIPRQR
jgi:hypothetical protein